MKNFEISMVNTKDYGAYMCGHENVFVECAEVTAETAEIAKEMVKAENPDKEIIGCNDITNKVVTTFAPAPKAKKTTDPVKNAKAQKKRYMTEIEKAYAEMAEIKRKIAKYEKKIAEYEKIINA